MEAMQTQTVEVMAEVRGFLQNLENLNSTALTPERIRARITELERWVEELHRRVTERLQGEAPDLGRALARLADCLGRVRADDWTRRDIRKASYTAIGQAYEAVVLAIKKHGVLARCAEQIHTLRPTNYWRNFFHAFMGLVGVGLYEWVFDGQGQTLLVLVCIFGVYAFLEVSRRYSKSLNAFYVNRLFKRIARPRETFQISAATWFVVGLFLAVAIADQALAQTAVLTLSIGDPAATLVGKRWGRRPLWRHRTLLGSIAFVASAALVSFGFLWGIAGFQWGTALSVALVAALVGGITELLCTERIDDNLAIPPVVALVLTLCFGSL